ncbi:MAG: hydrogenase [Planctomycetes bacterium]|nr:hydrogenase [Planctomycetota bacterium]
MWLDYLSVIFILTNFVLLASSRLGFCIKAVTIQGVVLAIIPLVHEGDHLGVASLVLCAVTLAVKGYAFPKLLNGAISRARIRREVEPLVGYSTSILLGLAMLVFGFWLQSRLPLGGNDGLLLPASFFAILAGFFVTIGRRKALTQILGYLALENGIFAFGAAALPEHPWMLELGVLLDVFVAVLVMGVAVFRISEEFEHIDVDRLRSLRDPVGEG